MDIYGSELSDWLIGTSQSDAIYGEDSCDTIEGGLGNDLIDGGDGDDTASYANSTKGVKVDLSIAIGQVTNVGTDTLANIENLLGSTFNDTLSGNSSNNTIDGGAGVDTLSYKTATNGVAVSLSTEEVQNTGLGNDIIKNMENILGSDYDDVLGGNSGDNTIDGGLGVDTVSYAGYENSSNTTGVVVDLSKTTVQATGAGNDIIKNTENVLGSLYDDVLAGNKYNNTIDGGAGDDYISADLGDDIIYGGSGYDFIEGGLGDDTIDGGTGRDTVSYNASTKAVTINLSTIGAQDTIGAGVDTIVNTENILGSKYNDTLTGNNNSNTIEGELGNDLIDGGDGDDFISGGKGADILSGGAGYDLLQYYEDAEDLYINIATNEARGGIAQGDVIDGFEGIESGSGNDMLIGNDENNELFGNEGDDIIFGGLGNDIIIEDSGHNTLYGEDGNDYISGGTDDDFIIGGDGNDTIYGKYGNDRISGGEGSDIFVFDTELNEDGNVDKISDFIYSDDVFYIDNDIFESFSSVIFGSIESENFVSGKSVIDENDYIIYDADTGNIWYDADGSGVESSAMLFATLCNKPADVDYTNFIVI